MSFGFSISDFICCGQIAYELYTEFKEAAGECQAFAKELLLLHQVILKTEALIGRGNHGLEEVDQATLGLHIDMCKDILFVQLAGEHGNPWDGMPCHRPLSSGSGNLEFRHGKPSDYAVDRTLHEWTCSVRRKFEERNFAKKIPKIRAAISTVIEKLTSFQVLMVR